MRSYINSTVLVVPAILFRRPGPRNRRDEVSGEGHRIEPCSPHEYSRWMSISQPLLLIAHSLAASLPK